VEQVKVFKNHNDEEEQTYEAKARVKWCKEGESGTDDYSVDEIYK